MPNLLLIIEMMEHTNWLLKAFYHHSKPSLQDQLRNITRPKGAECSILAASQAIYEWGRRSSSSGYLFWSKGETKPTTSSSEDSLFRSRQFRYQRRRFCLKKREAQQVLDIRGIYSEATNYARVKLVLLFKGDLRISQQCQHLHRNLASLLLYQPKGKKLVFVQPPLIFCTQIHDHWDIEELGGLVLWRKRTIAQWLTSASK